MNEWDTPDLPPGTSVNGAVVEARVDSGGQGTVYRARDARTGTLYALKFIPLNGAAGYARRESLLAFGLQHENLVRVVGYGYWPLQVPEFVCLKMLYVEGRQLDEWALEEDADARAIAGKLVGVARGLAVVHGHDIVHRDLKEANILVRDRDGEPVLVDFGVAWREGLTTLTQGLYPPGTPLYRSPEAWRFGVEEEREAGARYRPGKADDLYAVGVVLYRLLTGRFPFEVALDDERSLRAVIHQKPLPPHIVNPRVPEPLSHVCMKLLEKRPEDRYPSALALHDALKEQLAGADDSWRVPLRGGRRARGRGGWKDLVKRLVPVAVLVGLVLGGAWLVARWRPEPRTPPVVSSSPSPTWRLLSGQEMAPAWPPPEIERAAAPPPAKKTPAAVAPKVTRPKDDDVKKNQKGPLSPWAQWCLGAAAAAHSACTGAQVRPAPEPEACPPGAVETMRETLGIAIEEEDSVYFPHAGQHHPVPVSEGFTSVEIPVAWGQLPGGTFLLGRLYFGEGRIYGRFTEARTPTGDTYKVCMEMWQEGKRGAEMEPGGDREGVRIFSLVKVQAVRHFE